MTDVAQNIPRNIHLALQYHNENQAEMRVVARNNTPLTVQGQVVINNTDTAVITRDITTSYDDFGRHRVIIHL